ncbi:reverse transcriptase [Senna tora]|uniref:Reverse transcriptase n=1 Tax=Senna tora TaxID=362788 RepID=A0A834W7V8_9FABA|nr:reverse transcriptase [Senna tora]
MKNKTCKMVSDREQLTIDLDATVIRSKKFELERDSVLIECKKLELKRDAALIDSKQLELKREIDQLELKQLKTDIVDMGREVAELKEQIMAAINYGWSNCLSQLYVFRVVARGKLTKPKSSGGMGFKYLSSFNLALVAKHACRVLNNPNELWVKVLKGLYFQILSSFMLARGLGFVVVVRPFRRKGDFEKGVFFEVW